MSYFLAKKDYRLGFSFKNKNIFSGYFCFLFLLLYFSYNEVRGMDALEDCKIFIRKNNDTFHLDCFSYKKETCDVKSDKLCEEILEKTNHKKLSILSCHPDSLNDKTLHDVVKVLHENGRLSFLKVFDLSLNSITENSAQNLKTLALANQDILIDLTSTPVGLKKIKNLYDKIKYERDILSIMRHFIFVSKSYLPKASDPQKVKIYSSLIQNEVIPKNWADIHREYYKSDSLKFMLEHKELANDMICPGAGISHLLGQLKPKKKEIRGTGLSKDIVRRMNSNPLQDREIGGFDHEHEVVIYKQQ